MKKYGKRVIGVILMVLAMVLTQIPMPVLEATSATADFERDGDTLIHYTGTASAVSVPAGIREIAPEAFADQNGITKVYIPSSVEKIGEGAFRNCTNLKEVSLQTVLLRLKAELLPAAVLYPVLHCLKRLKRSGLVFSREIRR